ncbi:MAG: ornithine carbamoyltransferase [Candidatus Lokiarchaeota archaeon]|nr:ornithine carbamoyltransferase [Candidatus Lokiarchaeota archaeon]
MVRHLLKISDFTKAEIEKIINKAIEIKNNPQDFTTALKGETLLMIFEKPSLRTRISFEVGMQQLGGHAIFYSIIDSPLGRKENIHDTAKTASKYINLIAARLFKRHDMWDLAKYADVPVINMLDDFAHPCQMMGDFLTIKEKKGRLNNFKIGFFGDAYNNVTYDLMRICAIFGLELDVACPAGSAYTPEQGVLDEISQISKETGAYINVIHDALNAARDSDIIYTDSWMSYGIPREKEEERRKIFTPFQVNSQIMEAAKSDAIFMNCLPAKRGYEQTTEVIDGPQSFVFDQAENRLHSQKAIMLFLRDKF